MLEIEYVDALTWITYVYAISAFIFSFQRAYGFISRRITRQLVGNALKKLNREDRFSNLDLFSPDALAKLERTAVVDSKISFEELLEVAKISLVLYIEKGSIQPSYVDAEGEIFEKQKYFRSIQLKAFSNFEFKNAVFSDIINHSSLYFDPIRKYIIKNRLDRFSDELVVTYSNRFDKFKDSKPLDIDKKIDPFL